MHEHDDQKRRKRKKGDKRQGTPSPPNRRRPSSKPKNGNQTETSPSKTEATRVRSFISVKMVDRPVVKDNRKRAEVEESTAIAKRTKAEGNSLQEPKLETVSVLATWNLKRKKEQTKKKKIHWSDCDVKVVYLEEANPTRNVMQRGEAHQILPIFLE